ncbi:tyrosine-type recombinase/integrase [candidate division KSB1 bacterium]|nr:tyrosine-type recombinase/integrase [candidate division KSB1 bacterium]
MKALQKNAVKHRFYDNQIQNVNGLSSVLTNYEKFLNISTRAQGTRDGYRRAIRDLCIFSGSLPTNIEPDHILDYLNFLKDEKKLSWQKIKWDVASIKHYYRHIEHDEDMALQIPYPKEQKTLPMVLSREELKRLFSSCHNNKHRVMFRLLYSSGLRRMELLNLKINDIETKDEKFRIRINNGKGGKDRYTVLSKKVHKELQDYYRQCYPKVYLFNGRQKGRPMSAEGLRHALNAAIKRSGITKEVNLHILRHCFASHALEDGMNIKTLQHLLGHSSINTTLIYLHVSDIPLRSAFSPLDNIDE